MRWPWMLAFYALVAGCHDSSGGALRPLRNRCLQIIDCPPDSKCDPEFGICVQEATHVPYQIAVRITADPLPDAGPLAPFTSPPMPFSGTLELGSFTVPSAVHVRGNVLASDGKTSLKAEVIFTPRDGNGLLSPVSTFTFGSVDGQAFDVLLSPNTAYDVLVYPRGPDSESFPPSTYAVQTSNADQMELLRYPVMRELRGELHDDNGRPAPLGLTVKLRWRDRMLASSSIGTIGAGGSFRVFAPAEVLEAPARHELVVDLSSVVGQPNVLIAFDLAQMPPDAKLTMPVLPPPVEFIGHVEVSDLGNQALDVSSLDAQLTWISDFPVPAQSSTVAGRDWCRLKLTSAAQGTFRCSARVSTTVGANLQVRVQLMPGDYDVFVEPTGRFAPRDRIRVATKSDTKTVELQPDGVPQEGHTFSVTRATEYRGCAVSPSGKAMPGITVSASALGVRGDLPELALFNRSDEQVSDAKGRFQLAVDVGWYDLIATTPRDSGYAWVLDPNRRIDGMRNPVTGDERNRDACEPSIKPEVPVLARGRALDRAGFAIPGARIDGYAIVPSLEGGTRAVRIAQATSDEEGTFVLQLPPSIGEPDDMANDAGMALSVRDGGVALGASLDISSDASR